MNIAYWEDMQVDLYGDECGLLTDEGAWTNAGLFDASRRLASAFENLGIGCNDRIAILLPNSLELYIAASAAVAAGGAAVIFPAGPEALVARMLEHCRPAIIVGLKAHTSWPYLANGPWRRVILDRPGAMVGDSSHGFYELIRSHHPLSAPVPRKASDIAQLCYTSGATGIPKAVVYTHGAVEEFYKAMSIYAVGHASNTTLLAVPPTAFGGRMVGVRAVGNKKYVLQDRFDPPSIFLALERYKVMDLPLVPTMAELLLCTRPDRPYDWSALQTISVGGAHVSASLIRRLKEKFSVVSFDASRPVGKKHPKIAVFYGMTEAGGTIANTVEGGDGIVGKVPSDVDVKLIDESGSEVRQGQVGEVVARTPYSACGYWNDEERTAALFRDGYIHTGDLGYFDDERLLHLVGRKNDIIIQGGQNVLPQELINIIKEVDGVHDCAVIGIPNELLGEEVIACVVLTTGTHLREVDILRHCRSRLESRKVPGKVLFMDDLAQTHVGKLDRLTLREQVLAQLRLPKASELMNELATFVPSLRKRRLDDVVRDLIFSMLALSGGNAEEGRRYSVDATFAELGLDSLNAVNFAHRLSECLGRYISPVVVYTYTSPAKLSSWLMLELWGEELPTDTKPPPRQSEPIDESLVAIVGAACRLPAGAHTPEQFWRLLEKGMDAVGSLHSAAGYRKIPPGRQAAFLDNPSLFDAHFFSLGSTAAEIDPRHRMLLELAWEALEDSGCDPLSLSSRKVGVYFGLYGNFYTSPDPLGTSPGMAVARLSHFLNLSGPAFTVDTTCSSSMVALHYAVVDLKRGACDIALVGAANLLGPQLGGDDLGVISPRGRSSAFDAAADGFGQGEGAVMLVLKRVHDIDVADRMYAVIAGTAINHDGHSNSLTAPNPCAQEEVIKLALQTANLPADSVQYVEAHGTGTLLGDPIEIEGLARVFGGRNGKALKIGSVKTNIGHLEAAAGIAGVLKAALAIRHRRLPGSIHFSRPNPHIPWSKIPIEVQSEAGDWPSPGAELIAGVSSYGMSGTNAHTILREAGGPRPLSVTTPLPARKRLLPLSARSRDALVAQAERWVRALQTETIVASDADIAYTASCRRAHLEYRLAVPGSDRNEWALGLRGRLTTASAATRRCRPFSSSQLIFVFSGQGTQWWGMGHELYRTEPVFREAVNKCSRLFNDAAGWELREVFDSANESDKLEDTRVAQAALFTLQAGLSELWRSWGVIPGAVVGHSLGEITAAHVAGILSLEQAVKVISERSRIVHDLKGRGRMAAVMLPLADTRKLLEGFSSDIEIAASNSSHSTTVSGDGGAVVAFVGAITARGIKAKLLPGDYAFHHSGLCDAASILEEALANLEAMPPRIPLISTLTGGVAKDMTGRHWAHQMVSRVKFHEAIGAALNGCSAFLELGAKPVLAPYIESIIKESPGKADTAVVVSLGGAESEADSMLAALGELYVAGYQVEWPAQYPNKGSVAELPLYCWQHTPYWYASAEKQEKRPMPLVDRSLFVAPDGNIHCYELVLDGNNASRHYLWEHQISGTSFLPAAAFMEFAMEAAAASYGRRFSGLKQLQLKRELVLTAGKTVFLQVKLDTSDREQGKFAIFSREEAGEFVLHMDGEVCLSGAPGPGRTFSLTLIQERCEQEESLIAFESLFARAGVDLGKDYRLLTALWSAGEEMLGRVELRGDIGQTFEDYHVHPAILDTALRSGAAVGGVNGRIDSRISAPIQMSELKVHYPGCRPTWSYARQSTLHGIDGLDVYLLDAEGKVLIEMLGLQGRPDDPGLRISNRYLYQVQWEERTRGKAGLATGRWWILRDDGNTGRELAAMLQRQSGVDVVSVAKGSAYRRHDQSTYELDPFQAANYSRLMTDVREPPSHIVYLWSLDTRQENEVTESVQQNISTLMYLSQALQASSKSRCRLYFVTRGVQPMDSGIPQSALGQAAIWGFALSLARENPDVECRMIDIDPCSKIDLDALYDELLTQDCEDRVVMKENERRVARLVRHLPAEGNSVVRDDNQLAGSNTRAEVGVRDNSSYLITGGLGGLGLITADRLAALGARHLILMGRRGPTPAAAKVIESLERQGVSVRIELVDVSDSNALAKSLRNVDVPKIAGVVHAAGAIRDGAVANLNEEDVAEVLSAKAKGAWNLHCLLPGTDFFILYSSTAGLFGNPGQTLYSAANAFIDALAHYRTGLGLPAQTINWGGWAGVGMAANIRAADGLFQRQEGEAILDTLLRQSTTQVMAFSPSLWKVSGPRALAGNFFEKFTASGNGPQVHAEAEGCVGSGQPSSTANADIERFLRAKICSLVGIAEEDIHGECILDQLGVDSLSLIRLRAALRNQFGVALPSSLLASSLSFRELVLCLRGGYAGAGGGSIEESSKKDGSFCWLGHNDNAETLILIHPIGGGVSAYKALAETGSWNLGAIQSPLLHADTLTYRSIGEIARHYLEILADENIGLPYVLGGWSLGGLIALEMASQLRSQNQRVPLLAMIDTHPPYPARLRDGGSASEQRDVIDDVTLTRQFILHMCAEGSSLTPDTVEPILSSHLTGTGKMPVPDVMEALSRAGLLKNIGVEDALRLFEIFRLHVRALRAYVLPEYSGRVLLIRADSSPRALDTVWRKALPKVEIAMVEGDHYSIMHQQKMFQILSSCKANTANYEFS